MSRGPQLFTVLVAVLVVCSVLSHSLMWLLEIRTDVVDRGKICPDYPGQPVLVTDSSLTFFDVSFAQVAKAIQRPLITRGVGGASPCELELLLREVPQANRLFIGLSIFDLNENNLSDSRPTLVPFTQTVGDLHASRSDWTVAKRVLWTYPIPWLQYIFPVAGRSNTVMVKARDKVRNLRQHPPAAEPESGLSFKSDEESGHPEKLSDWDPGRVERNVSQLAATGLATGRFSGPKSMALARILEQAARQEPTLVFVFPVSPAYRQALITTDSQKEFERALERLKILEPNLQLIRLDQEVTLQSAEVFWDLVHLNDDGRRIATRLVLEHLAAGPVP